MEDFDTYAFPNTIETDILIIMSLNTMLQCKKHGLTSEEVWSHFVAFGLAGEA